MKINLTSLHRRISPDLSAVRCALIRLGASQWGANRRVDIVFTNDKTIAELAGRYRFSPHATDVLAFSYAPVVVDGLLGEVVISLDTARRQARERNMQLETELILLSVHGLLHIAGQGDETSSDRRAMRIMEFETMMRIL